MDFNELKKEQERQRQEKENIQKSKSPTRDFVWTRQRWSDELFLTFDQALEWRLGFHSEGQIDHKTKNYFTAVFKQLRQKMGEIDSQAEISFSALSEMFPVGKEVWLDILVKHQVPLFIKVPESKNVWSILVGYLSPSYKLKSTIDEEFSIDVPNAIQPIDRKHIPLLGINSTDFSEYRQRGKLLAKSFKFGSYGDGRIFRSDIPEGTIGSLINQEHYLPKNFRGEDEGEDGFFSQPLPVSTHSPGKFKGMRYGFIVTDKRERLEIDEYDFKRGHYPVETDSFTFSWDNLYLVGINSQLIRSWIAKEIFEIGYEKSMRFNFVLYVAFLKWLVVSLGIDLNVKNKKKEFGELGKQLLEGDQYISEHDVGNTVKLSKALLFEEPDPKCHGVMGVNLWILKHGYKLIWSDLLRKDFNDLYRKISLKETEIAKKKSTFFVNNLAQIIRLYKEDKHFNLRKALSEESLKSFDDLPETAKTVRYQKQQRALFYPDRITARNVSSKNNK